MDLRQLNYFVAVAEAGHITRAAARLGMQQPPLSMQIRALEKYLGFELFRRHAKGVSLTDRGRVFHQEALRLLRDVDALEHRATQMARGMRGALSLALTSSVGAHPFIPRALRAYREAFPDVELILSEGNAAEITEAIAGNRVQCGILRLPVATIASIASEHLLHEAVLVAVPQDHHLAQGHAREPRPITLADFHGEDLILTRRPGAPGLYGNLLSLLEQNGHRARVIAEVERMTTNLNLVAAGHGISVVPASMRQFHSGLVAYLPLASDIALDAPLTLVHRAGDSGEVTEPFMALLRKLARQFEADAPGRSGSAARRGRP